MSDADDVRRLALALPGAEEHTHFRLPAFRVGDKVFAVLQEDGHAILHVDEPTATQAASGAVQQVTRPGPQGRTIFVGVRVALAEVPADRLESLVAAAWRHRAPRRLRGS